MATTMADDKKTDVERLIEQETHVHNEKHAHRIKALRTYIDEYIEHADPRHEENALKKGYQGSAVRTTIKNDKGETEEVWEQAGLKHVFSELYQSNQEVVKEALDNKDKDAPMKGLEHFLITAAESLQDNAEAQATVKKIRGRQESGIYKKENGDALRQEDIAEVAQHLYLGERELQTYLAAASSGNIDEFRTVLQQFRDNVPTKIVREHKKTLKEHVDKTPGGKDHLKANVYNILHDDDKPADGHTYLKIDPDEMLEIHYNRIESEAYDAAKKKRLGKEEK